MTPEDPSFFTLRDDDMRSIATAAPRRTPAGRGADIGGRLRVARILQSAGVTSAGQPVRIAGATNEVWQAGDYIIRVGFQTGAERLRRESRLSHVLPESVRYPHVVASGVEPFGEWIIVRRTPGVALSEAWSHMEVQQRRTVVFELGRAMKTLHATRLPANDHSRHAEISAEGLEFHEGEGHLALPHQLPPTRILELLEEARYLHGMDRSLIDDVIAKTKEFAPSMPEHEKCGLIHGDLHFENVLVDNGRMSAIVDFEWSRPGPVEIDIDMLARFCTNPALHIGGSYPVNAADFRDVLRWMCQVYPDIFGAADFKKRLFLCALAFDVPWLLRMETNGSYQALPAWHPLNQIRDLMVLGSHAERLGW